VLKKFRVLAVPPLGVGMGSTMGCVSKIWVQQCRKHVVEGQGRFHVISASMLNRRSSVTPQSLDLVAVTEWVSVNAV